jgi:hypothetical protein
MWITFHGTAILVSMAVPFLSPSCLAKHAFPGHFGYSNCRYPEPN